MSNALKDVHAAHSSRHYAACQLEATGGEGSAPPAAVGLPAGKHTVSILSIDAADEVDFCSV
jgi:hypothetical protein